MGRQVYDRITQSCMITVMISAVLFDRTFGVFQVSAGLLGIAAGVTASATYFYNQWHKVRSQKYF